MNSNQVQVKDSLLKRILMLCGIYSKPAKSMNLRNVRLSPGSIMHHCRDRVTGHNTISGDGEASEQVMGYG